MVHWLIDGHNLIGQLQDISLDDPHDEAKLAFAVRRYCAGGRCKAMIIFDNGITGGVSKQLSNSDVTVVFAPQRTSADNLLMQKARTLTNDPNYRDFVLVTSDRRISQLAFAYGVETLSSEEFAIMLGFRPVELPAETPNAPRRVVILYDKDPNPNISAQEVAYWLPIFKARLEQFRANKMAAQVAAETELAEKRQARKARKEVAKQTEKANRRNLPNRPTDQ
jgi:predicted RNA-binding protein with PIN domain